MRGASNTPSHVVGARESVVELQRPWVQSALPAIVLPCMWVKDRRCRSKRVEESPWPHYCLRHAKRLDLPENLQNDRAPMATSQEAPPYGRFESVALLATAGPAYISAPRAAPISADA